jgi:hypothetical protein
MRNVLLKELACCYGKRKANTVSFILGHCTMLQAGRSRFRVPMRWIFQFTLYFQPHYGPWVDSDSNRNEYQESSWGVNGGRRIRLTTLLTSVSQMYRENLGTSISHNPNGLHGLLQGLPCFILGRIRSQCGLEC